MGCSVSGDVRLVSLVMLVFTLACSELPELTALMDNPSNDFTVLPPASAAVTVVAAQVTVNFCVSQAAVHPAFVEAPQHESAFRGPRDILALYSLLRT